MHGTESNSTLFDGRHQDGRRIEPLVALWFAYRPGCMGHTTWRTLGTLGSLAPSLRLLQPSASAHPRNAASLNSLSRFGGLGFLLALIFSYTANADRFINSLCAGVVVFVLSIMASMAGSRTMASRSASNTTLPHRM